MGGCPPSLPQPNADLRFQAVPRGSAGAFVFRLRATLVASQSCARRSRGCPCPWTRVRPALRLLATEGLRALENDAVHLCGHLGTDLRGPRTALTGGAVSTEIVGGAAGVAMPLNSTTPA